MLTFRLTSAPETFQRLMERVLHGLYWKSLLLYLDDIIVIAPDFATHLQGLEKVFCRLRKAAKCKLLQKEVKYLGHIVSSSRVAADPVKVSAIQDCPASQGVKELQGFPGTVGYYRQYLEDFSTTA